MLSDYLTFCFYSFPGWNEYMILWKFSFEDYSSRLFK
ncbi:MAG: hypothetical protein HDS62_02240 [Bacteroidales bacterium]|nr:hypothetical protein [Bacteroidales bacterium]